MTDLATRGHDSAVRLTRSDFETLERIDEVIERAVEEGNPRVAFRFGQGFRRAQQISGLALAKLAYEMRERWGTDFPSDDEFIDVASQQWSYSVETLRRYIKVWEYVVVPWINDEERYRALLAKPIDGLYRISEAAKQGELEEEHWEEIELAPNIHVLKEIRKKVRGEQTSSNSAIYILLERDGTLKARQGEGNYEPFGFFILKKRDDEVLGAAIERIINEAGVVER